MRIETGISGMESVGKKRTSQAGEGIAVSFESSAWAVSVGRLQENGSPAEGGEGEG